MANSNPELNIRNGYIAPDTVIEAERVLRETPEVREAAVKELRELLKAATDINYKDDDAFLVIWLRACHFYPQSALEKVGGQHIRLLFGYLVELCMNVSVYTS